MSAIILLSALAGALITIGAIALVMFFRALRSWLVISKGGGN